MKKAVLVLVVAFAAVSATAGSLSDDGRVGLVVESQGIVGLRPATQSRWTPAFAGLVLKPGDWVRTGPRGANALHFRTTGGAEVIMGPDSLMELLDDGGIKITRGEVEVGSLSGGAVVLHGPGGSEVKVKKKSVYRVTEKKTERLKEDPAWLAGFKGVTAGESMGSLVARVDGRDVPLTIGFHRVTVDIRDQIARTVIEESFVNHTKNELEGVFYFPLPADASISGFGMWIGDQLVEADVVEKQRAREIYETILREKRDPGLLEWSGGNIFKARVYPIFAHAEKRIKITYTQVLPMQGGRYRYSYALQSDMLRENPLRELELKVTLYSSDQISAVECVSHEVRGEKTAHSASVEFSAQEYTPTADFEVVVEVKSHDSGITVVPHRRGEDGYFLMLFSPPGGGGAADRALVPEGEPLQLTIVADSSGSTGAEGLKSQLEFIESLLSSLGDKDRFNVLACDVECRAVFDAPQGSSAENLSLALGQLEKWGTLGWSDLDGAFGAAFKEAAAKGHVLYVGDGVVTTGDGDGVALINRVKKLYEGKEFRVHTVAPTSSYDAGVMQGLASLGGGSFRRMQGPGGAGKAALALLNEIAQPSVSNVKVEFSGLQVARVYPGELPNIPVGTQQIMLGRYLPEGKGKVSIDVSGRLDGKEVKYSRAVELPDGDAGNSFIPRLWARMHLDYLLSQGRGPQVKEDVIALSEEYNIMTPYTSLLVLESDADRERFKVKRRFRIRDGEKFFAKGREEANTELLQKQMKRAGNWRIALRDSMVGQLAVMGRYPYSFGGGGWQQGGLDQYSPGLLGGLRDSSGSMALKTASVSRMTEGKESISLNGGGESGRHRMEISEKDGMKGQQFTLDGEDGGFWNVEDSKQDVAKMPVGDLLNLRSADMPVAANEPMEEEQMNYAVALPPAMAGKRESRKSLKANMALSETMARPDAVAAYAYDDFAMSGESFGLGSGYFGPTLPAQYFLDELSGKSGAVDWSRDYRGQHGMYDQEPYWFTQIFPYLGPAPVTPDTPPATPMAAWPMDARAVSDLLYRGDLVRALDGGLKLERFVKYYAAPRQTVRSVSQATAFLSKKQWFTLDRNDTDQTYQRWCDAKECGVLSIPLQAGRVRDAVAVDTAVFPYTFSSFSFTKLHESYYAGDYVIEMADEPDGKVRLTLRHRSSSDYEVHLIVDRKRGVLLANENFSAGKLTGKTMYSDFVEVGGAWWPGKSVTTDAQGKVTATEECSYQLLADDSFEDEVAGARKKVDGALMLHEPLVTMLKAKGELDEGKKSVEGRLRLVMHFGASQQWDKAFEHFAEVEKLVGGKEALKWLYDQLLSQSRRTQELQVRMTARAKELVSSATADEYFLVRLVDGLARVTLHGNELMELMEILKPAFLRAPEHVQGDRVWRMDHFYLLQQVGRQDEAFKELEALAQEYPHAFDVQNSYVYQLSYVGEFDKAYAWLDRLIEKEGPWERYCEESLRTQYTSFLDQQGRFEELEEYLEKWLSLEPEGATAYQQYLSVLVRLGRVKDADSLVERWLKLALDDKELSPPGLMRVQAAVNHSLGQQYYNYSNRADPKWFKLLARVATALAPRMNANYVCWQIFNHWEFRGSEEGKALFKVLAKRLQAEVATMEIFELQTLVSWLLPQDTQVGEAAWRKIAAGLEERWDKEEDEAKKLTISGTLVQVLVSFGPPEAYLAFLRKQWKKASKDYVDTFADQLFNALMVQPWSEDVESQAYTMLGHLGSRAEPLPRLALQAGRLMQLNDQMVSLRNALALEEAGKKGDLTKTEHQALLRKAQREAREGVIARLVQQREKQAAGLRPWLEAERVYFEVLMKKDLAKSAAQCWEYMPQLKADARHEDVWLEEALRERLLGMLEYLAFQPGAGEGAPGALLEFYRKEMKNAVDKRPWRLRIFRLLVVQDRPEDLEQLLRQWAQDDKPDRLWQVTLAYLMAETGRVKDAIPLFEAVEKADELTPGEYKVLADWYLVVGEKEKRIRAQEKMLEGYDEYSLHGMVQNTLYGPDWQGESPPDQISPETLRILSVLLRKAQYPQSYVWTLGEFYRRSHDFQLLRCLAEGMLGHTAEQVYPVLESLYYTLQEVLDEATVDSIVGEIVKVRARSVTDIDRRALDMLEAMIYRRAAEVSNESGPHVRKAVAAMERAFKGDWGAGERLLMARTLAAMGQVSRKELSKLQLSQLGKLHKGEKKGSQDRMEIAYSYGATLWNYGEFDDAIDLYLGALREYRKTGGGVLPQSANNVLSSVIYYMGDRQRFMEAEKLVRVEIEQATTATQRSFLRSQLFSLYERALRAGAATTLGRGSDLYVAARKEMLEWLDTTSYSNFQSAVGTFVYFHQAAHDSGMARAKSDLQEFASTILAKLKGRQPHDYNGVVSTVSNTLHWLAGAKASLEFLVTALEQEPPWFAESNQDGFSYHSYNLGQWRSEAGKLGPLEKRLLKLVLASLEKDLVRLYDRGCSTMYHECGGYLWNKKVKDFVRVAQAVAREHADSGQHVEFVANYLVNGLKKDELAIKLWKQGFKKGVLSDAGLSAFVNVLQRLARHKEAVPVLEYLVKKQPTQTWYRERLIVSYAKSGKRKQALTLLKKSEKYLRKENLWGEYSMASLAAACVEAGLNKEAAAYYEEAIPAHQRAAWNRGIGDGMLADYYAKLATAYTALGDTVKAVEAASGAIVSWGSDYHQRQYATQTLRDALAGSKELKSYVKTLDAQVEKSGLENPIVRKALGTVFLDKGKCRDAAEQFKASIEAQPYDGDAYRGLVGACTCLRSEDDAIVALQEWSAFSRHDIELMRQLGDRLAKVGRKAEAERAWSAIVEVLPEESESHRLLAQVREGQARWPEAIVQWEQVVRIRTEEPEGYLGLANALVHGKSYFRAGQVLAKLLSKKWPSHFGDVHNQARELMKRLKK